MTAQKVVRDTPNMKNLFELLKQACNDFKPRALSTITTIEPSFSEDWGGFYLVNNKTAGDHFWLGIWWDKPYQLQFAFAPALYNKDKIEGWERDAFDWWPYVPHELTNEFFTMSPRSQLNHIQKFVNDTLKEFAKAKRHPEQ